MSRWLTNPLCLTSVVVSILQQSNQTPQSSNGRLDPTFLTRETSLFAGIEFRHRRFCRNRERPRTCRAQSPALWFPWNRSTICSLDYGVTTYYTSKTSLLLLINSGLCILGVGISWYPPGTSSVSFRIRRYQVAWPVMAVSRVSANPYRSIGNGIIAVWSHGLNPNHLNHPLSTVLFPFFSSFLAVIAHHDNPETFDPITKSKKATNPNPKG